MYTRVRKRLIPISENLPDQADRVLCKMALRVVVKKKKKKGSDNGDDIFNIGNFEFTEIVSV